MTIQESLKRTYNLVGVVIVGLAGISFFPSVFVETERDFKIDEGGLLLVAIAAIAWYRSGKNKFSHTLMPFLFSVLALALKLLAIVLELKDKEDVGDDFGGTVLFIAGSLFVLWLYFNTKKLLKAHKT